MTEAIPNMLDRQAMKIGRFTNGTVSPTIIIPPEYNALAPTPAMARPTINVTEFWAVAQTIEPTSKTTIPTK
jgi:hypothetical protein